MPTLDLPAKYLSLLLQALDAHVPDAEVWAYGSRVKAQAHDGSDLDLVLRNPGQLDRAQDRLPALRDALEESNIPILMEVLDWARLPAEFRREIERSHVVVRTALAPTR